MKVQDRQNGPSKSFRAYQKKLAGYAPGREVRQMIGLTLKEAVKTAMQNHIYKFNGVARRQAEGGAIGEKLTGAMAKAFMSRWTKEFRERVLNATKNIDGFEFHALKYCVDDIKKRGDGSHPSRLQIDWRRISPRPRRIGG